MGRFIPKEVRDSLPDVCQECDEPLESPVHGDGEGQHIPEFFCKNIECLCGMCEDYLYEMESEMESAEDWPEEEYEEVRQ